MSTIAVIIGSTRPNRLGPAIAGWVAALGRGTTTRQVEILDLRDWPLPMDDEPGIPAHGGYAHEHSKAWSRKIAGCDAFVFVTPQYNWGYPAPLKNAIDHLHGEWRGKPAAIISYGGHGGGKCAMQLRQVLDGLKMSAAGPPVELTLPAAIIVANTGAIDADHVFAGDVQKVTTAFAILCDRMKDGVPTD